MNAFIHSWDMEIDMNQIIVVNLSLLLCPSMRSDRRSDRSMTIDFYLRLSTVVYLSVTVILL